MIPQSLGSAVLSVVGVLFAALSVEWVGVIIGSCGFVMGCLALYKAVQALTRLNEIADTQAESVDDLAKKADVVESKLTGQ